MNNFEIERQLSVPEYLNLRFTEVVKGVENIAVSRERGYGDRPNDGFTEHVARLDPARQDYVAAPQIDVPKEAEVTSQINEDEEDARRLVNSVFSADTGAQSFSATTTPEKIINATFDEIFTENPDLASDTFDLQG